MWHTSLYISVQIQNICFLQLNIAICLLSILLEKKLKTLRHLSFAKSLQLSLFLQRVLMGFSVCSARFLVGSGGLLLWFLWKRNTPTFMRNTAIEQVIKLFLWVQTWF